MLKCKPSHKLVINTFKEIVDNQNIPNDFESKLFTSFNPLAKIPEQVDIIDQCLSDFESIIGEETSSLLADFLLNTHEHRGIPFSFTANYLAAYYFLRYPTDEVTSAIATRLQRILIDPLGEVEIYLDLPVYDYSLKYDFPDPKTCLFFLLRCQQSVVSHNALREIVSGKYQQTLTQDGLSSKADVYDTLFSTLGEHFHLVLDQLFEKSELNYDFFKQIMTAWPKIFHAYWLYQETLSHPEFRGRWSTWLYNHDFGTEYAKYGHRLIDELVTQEAYTTLVPLLTNILGIAPKYGIKSLETGLTLIEKNKVSAAGLKTAYTCCGRLGNDPKADATYIFIRIAGLLPDETPAQLTNMLLQFKPAKLQLALPYLGELKSAVMEAIGWEALSPLDRLIDKTAHLNVDRLLRPSEIEYADDERLQNLDVSAIATHVSSINETDLTKYLKVIHAAGPARKGLAQIVKAIAGQEKEKTLSKLDSFDKKALLAYPFFPLLGEGDLRERVTFFSQAYIHAESLKPAQKERVQRHCTAGLNQLARLTGYPNVHTMKTALPELV